jgi:hypothetical protein
VVTEEINITKLPYISPACETGEGQILPHKENNPIRKIKQEFPNKQDI